eukprot:1647934-Prymnesium_polylepis.1
MAHRVRGAGRQPGGARTAARRGPSRRLGHRGRARRAAQGDGARAGCRPRAHQPHGGAPSGGREHRSCQGLRGGGGGSQSVGMPRWTVRTVRQSQSRVWHRGSGPRWVGEPTACPEDSGRGRPFNSARLRVALAAATPGMSKTEGSRNELRGRAYPSAVVARVRCGVFVVISRLCRETSDVLNV